MVEKDLESNENNENNRDEANTSELMYLVDLSYESIVAMATCCSHISQAMWSQYNNRHLLCIMY